MTQEEMADQGRGRFLADQGTVDFPYGRRAKPSLIRFSFLKLIQIASKASNGYHQSVPLFFMAELFGLFENYVYL